MNGRAPRRAHPDEHARLYRLSMGLAAIYAATMLHAELQTRKKRLHRPKLPCRAVDRASIGRREV
jgi:hypothetical protein